MARLFLIGDVHGCAKELADLVELLAPESGDQFGFVGDLVDKGPDSIGAITLAKTLCDLYPGSFCTAGNHEADALRQFEQGKLDNAEPWAKDMTDAHWAWLRAMPLTHRLSSGDLVVHGGLFPGFFRDHGDIPAAGFPRTWHRGGGKLMDRARRFLRVRYVDAEGDMVALGDIKPEHKHWTAVYDGRAGRVFFGHDPQLSGKPLVTPHAIGLDTACVFGRTLTAAVLRPGTDWLSFLSVPARERYCEPLAVL